MDRLIEIQENLNRETEIVADALNEARFAVLDDLLVLMENMRTRLDGNDLFNLNSRISGYQEALLDVMEIIKKRVSIDG